MSERRKIEEKIRRKEQEIQSLESSVHDARIYVQALQDVLKMLPKERANSSNVLATLRRGSSVAQTREAILKEGNPLHISIILQMIGKEKSREASISLSGSLAAYVRKEKIFTRTGPNTFGLIELGHKNNSPLVEPPSEFGKMIDNNDLEEDLL